MILVDIKLHAASKPGADPEYLGGIKIVNDGTGTELRGNYAVYRLGKNGRALSSARVENHPRKSNTVHNLIRKALEALDV